MTDTKTAVHPRHLEVTLTFNEEPHTYTDSIGYDYISVTQLLHKFQQPFDAEGISAALSRKRGIPAADIRREWEQGAADACEFGTRVHQNCENQFLGQYDRFHLPRNEKERKAFECAFNAVEQLKESFEFVAAEQLLFSPHSLLAGTCDLLMRQGDNLWIFDWKTNKEIKREGYKGKTMLEPISHLPDANFYHYALQLSLYERIIRLEGYLPAWAKQINRALLWIPPESDQPEFIELPDLYQESAEILLAHMCPADVLIPPF